MAWDSQFPIIGTFNASTGQQQYSVVALSTGQLLSRPTAGGRVLGVLVSSGTTGSTRETNQAVQVAGVAKCRVSTASTGIAAGQWVTPTTGGTVTPTSAADYTFGMALEGVGSTGTVIPVLITRDGTT